MLLLSLTETGKAFEEWFGKSGISIFFFRTVGIAERGVTGWERGRGGGGVGEKRSDAV